MNYEFILKIAGIVFTAGIIYGELKAISGSIRQTVGTISL